MGKYCGVQTCNRPGTVELALNETKNGVEIKGTTFLCVSHYDQAHPGTNPAWPKGGQHSFPAPKSTRNMWDWRPRIGETPEERLVRMEQDKAAAAYRETQEFRQNRDMSLGPFNVPQVECRVWNAGTAEMPDINISFVEADVFQEDVLDSLALHGGYVRVVHTLELEEIR